MHRIAFLHEHNEEQSVASEFSVTSVGVTVIDTYHEIISQPNGRHDYQIIYMHNGVGHYTFGGETVIVPTGTAVLYKPHESKIYTHYAFDNVVVAWIHFEGAKVHETLKELGLLDKQMITVNNGSKLFKNINAICDEYTKKDTGYTHCAEAILTKILVDLSRNSLNDAASRQEQMIESICEKIASEYSLNYDSDHYAAECGLSTSHFNVLFRKYTDTSPLQYKMNIRLLTARNLLVNSEYKIKEIASLIGFDDPLYFCKYFCKKYGMSPTEFRENYKK